MKMDMAAKYCRTYKHLFYGHLRNFNVSAGTLMTFKMFKCHVQRTAQHNMLDLTPVPYKTSDQVATVGLTSLNWPCFFPRFSTHFPNYHEPRNT